MADKTPFKDLRIWRVHSRSAGSTTGIPARSGQRSDCLDDLQKAKKRKMLEVLERDRPTNTPEVADLDSASR